MCIPDSVFMFRCPDSCKILQYLDYYFGRVTTWTVKGVKSGLYLDWSDRRICFSCKRLLNHRC